LPHVLRHYSVFDRHDHYFDVYRTRETCRRFVAESVRPVHHALAALGQRLKDRFCVNVAMTGQTLDLFEQSCPDAIESLAQLHSAGTVDFCAATYSHSLAFLYQQEEYSQQIEWHCRRVTELFGRRPAVLCNSELIHADSLARTASDLGLTGLVCDGAPFRRIGQSCAFLYSGGGQIRLFPRDNELSREIADGFNRPEGAATSITAPSFAQTLRTRALTGDVVTLVLDYGVFGIRNRRQSGVFEFLRHMPEQAAAHGDLDFISCEQAVERYPPKGEHRSTQFTSLEEMSGDLSPWLGSPLQSHVVHQLYALAPAIRSAADPALLDDWRRLQSCEYLLEIGDSGLHGGASSMPANIGSPYDAFINFMNICDSLGRRVSTGQQIEKRQTC
jgi:alpha-amylase